MRRRRAEKRQVLPDTRFDSLLVAHFVNMSLRKGKKSTAEKVIYGAIDIIKEKTGQDPIEVLDNAVNNARPLVETKSRRVGGATYQVPVEMTTERGVSVAVRWLLDSASARKGVPMKEALVQEIMDASNKTGTVMKKREETHKMAEANRAFAHYRW
ncbi:MAG: 30S ribosomal protein S7 [Chlamydiota bacterium]|nr:30S ribosomal protein S7 [Chlamydiota bacterium]